MLSRARKIKVFDRHEINVLNYEDIIGLKLQASVNDSERAKRDWSDIKLILDYLNENKLPIDWELLDEYFALFSMNDKLADLKASYE